MSHKHIRPRNAGCDTKCLSPQAPGGVIPSSFSRKVTPEAPVGCYLSGCADTNLSPHFRNRKDYLQRFPKSEEVTGVTANAVVVIAGVLEDPENHGRGVSVTLCLPSSGFGLQREVATFSVCSGPQWAWRWPRDRV